MANTNLLPDLELVVRTYLAGVTGIAALVGVDDQGTTRVYTRHPSPPPPTPYLLVRRLPSPPANRSPLWLDAGAIQLDAYGGTQRQANRLAETARNALDDLPAATISEGVITGVDHGAFGYLPDPDQLTERGNARERYVIGATVYAHPAR